MKREIEKNSDKGHFSRSKWHLESVYTVCVWLTDGTEDEFYINKLEDLDKVKSEISRLYDQAEIEAVICDDEPVEHEFWGPDFSDPDLSESICRFIAETGRAGAVRRKRLSMLEYVTLVCPDEFIEWLNQEDGAPDSGAVDQLYRR